MSWLSISWTPQRICNNTSRRSSLTVLSIPSLSWKQMFCFSYYGGRIWIRDQAKEWPLRNHCYKAHSDNHWSPNSCKSCSSNVFLSFWWDVCSLGILLWTSKISVNWLLSILPGVSYKKKHDPDCRRFVKDVLDLPFEYVKKQMVSTSEFHVVVQMIALSGTGCISIYGIGLPEQRERRPSYSRIVDEGGCCNCLHWWAITLALEFFQQ